MKTGIDARAAKWYRGTGIGTYTYQLINSINKIDSDNNYLLFMPEDCELSINFKKNFRIKNISENSNNNFWDEVNIPNILTNEDIKLYHVPQNGIGLPIDKTCPFIITLHDVIPYKMPETVGENYLRIFNEQMPHLISLCDGIITVSNYSKKDIIETFNFPENKIFVTYLAAEDIYRPINKDLSKKYIKEKYSISEDFILYIGGFSPRKNILGLIEAFSLLPIEIRNRISLVIAGKQGKSYAIYKKRSAELNIEDSVLFPGFISMEDIPYLYNAASLFVYPSFYEGFGLPPVEAMACGTPVITSNLTSIPEICDGSSILINPFDVDDIKWAMLKTLTDNILREEIIKKGIDKASELSWTKTASETIKAYECISQK